MNEVKFAFRQLLKSPGFTAVAVLTLALGIGANAGIFSVINALMLRPLPFPNAKRLFWLEEVSKENTQEPWGAHFLDWQEHSQTLEGIAAYDSTTKTLTGIGEAERVEVGEVSVNFLPLLGAQPLPPGRNFSIAEDKPGGSHVAILSHELWQRRYQEDPDIVGRSIVLDDASYTVIGVLPQSFRFFSKFDVWVPLALDAQRELTGPFFSYQPTVARLKAGVSPERAQSELNMLLQRYETTRPKKTPEFAARQTRLVSLREYFLGKTRRPLLVLLGAVVFVLLIACANVANLLSARAVTRQKELAIRAALGASRLRLTRLMLTECLLLAALGGGAGLLFAYWLVRVLSSLGLADMVGQIARVTDISVDTRVFGVGIVVSLATGIFFGLLPTLRPSRSDLNTPLREGAYGSKAQGRALRSGLLVSEVAIAIVLLTGAGLLMRSFVKLIEVNPGYLPENLLTAQLKLPPRYDTESKRAQFYDELLQRVARLPGVKSVGATSQLPLTRYNMGGTLRANSGAEELGKRETAAPISAVNSDYFRAMGISLRAGRLFIDGDTQGAPSVVLLSESLAQKLFPTHDPIGGQIFVAGSGAKQSTVIGVVDDIRHEGLDREPEPAAYVGYRQLPRPMMSLVLRTSVKPSSIASSLRAAVREMDPALPIFDVMTMDARLFNSVAGRRFNLLLLGAFAALALVLAGVGVYGVITYLVSERTREIGIRMALGATRSAVLKLVLRQGMKLAAIGVLLGATGALSVTHALTGLLYEVKPTDPMTFGAVCLLLLLVALLGCWLPARRAAGVDPMEAVRSE